MSATAPTPKRGGIHPVYGAPFVGGSDMDCNYELVNADVQCVSQLRTIKQLQNIQKSLEQARDNVAGVKFHGNLEVDDLKATTELDKANFVEKVELLVNSHGFQTFFFMKASDGKMYSLLTHAHLFTLVDVIQEHRNRASPHVPILDDNGTETASSKIASFSKYDSYEKLDCNLSRLAVQSVIGKVLQDNIKTRYSHLSDFRTLPGNVYFMMALEASNASVALDIDDAIDKFNNLSLTTYPGENVKAFATEALRLIKVMEGGYCLPLRLGSDLLKKVYSTSCEHFNRWIHAKLDEVRDLELLYKLKDPKLMMSDPKYATLGPIALCGFLQEKYGSLVTEKAWPALSATLPEGNLATIDASTGNGSVKRCFHCNATDHLRDTCPKLGRGGNRRTVGGRREKPGSGEGGGAPDNSTNGGGTNNTPSNPVRSPFPAWRYIEPVDKTSAVVIGDHTYKWCSKCRCRATGKQGYFTTHHFTHEHIDRPAPPSGVGASANHSAVITPLAPLADDDIVDNQIPDDEVLVFSGPWHTPIASSDDNVTVSCVLDDASACESPSMWLASFSLDPSNVDDQNLSDESSSDPAAASNDESPIAATTIYTSDLSTCDDQPSDEPVVATPVLCPPASSDSLLIQNESYQRIYNTRPPISVVDLDFTEYFSCDDLTCPYVGPGGFNCPHCPTGIFNTAFVLCNHCSIGYGFLGDVCDLCHQPLWGLHVLPTSLPSQQLSDYVENDPSCIAFIPKNSARTHHLFLDSMYVPLPSVNWVSTASCSDDDMSCFFDASATLSDVHLSATDSYPVSARGGEITRQGGAIMYRGDSRCGDNKAGGDSNRGDIKDGGDSHLGGDSHHVDIEHGGGRVRGDMGDATAIPWFHSGCCAFWCLPAMWLLSSIWDCLQSGWACVKRGLDALHSGFLSSLHFGCFACFTVGTLMWDAVDALSARHAVHVPRAVRRRRKPLVQFFPRHWMLLSHFMMLSGLRYGSPYSTTLQPVLSTYARCDQIATMVHMSPLVVWDLHRLRIQQTLGWNLPSFNNTPDTLVEPNLPAPLDCSTNEEYFDSVDILPSTDWLQLDWLFANHTIDCTVSPRSFRQPSRPGLNAALGGVNFLDCLGPSRLNKFPVIFDSGASIAISGNKGDFVGSIRPPARDLRLGGMARGAKVEGKGNVHWKFQTSSCSLTLILTCYYVPDCKARLLSPQRLLNAEKGVSGAFIVREEHATLELNSHPPLVIDYDVNNNLPVGLACNAAQSESILHASANLCVTDDTNQNLTPAQKLLLMWHYRFGHRSLAFVQHLLRLPIFSGDKYRSASRAELPKCATCEYAKAHARSTSGNSQSVNPLSDGALKDGALRPGSKISVDHFESRLKGRTYTSFGKTTSDQFVGGCIFVDHMSGYIHVEHQLGFSSSETIRAKQNFEQLALGHGVLVEEYLADNGVFSKTKFLDHIREHNQLIHYCGVNAHHKNAVAERAIRTVSELARSLLLHASIHWPTGVDGSLWPMAVDYATHLYNTLPNQHGICPADLFTGTTIPRHKLRECHVWGCPVYVLDPTLQQGMKLPRWQPRSRRGLFLGYSRHHSSDVPLILNLQTGSISPQFHVVFDDSFSTVTSIAPDDNPPDFWNAPNLDACIHRVPVDSDDRAGTLLPDDWLTPHELEEKRRRLHRQDQIRVTFAPTPTIIPPAAPSVEVPSPSGATSSPPPALPPAPAPTSAPVTTSPPASPASTPPPPPEDVTIGRSSVPEPTVRRSSRSTKGTFTSTKYIDEVYLSSILAVPRSHCETEMAYHAELHTDFDTGEMNHFDAHAFVAQIKKHDPDNPSYTEAMSGPDAHLYVEAMKQEINALLQQRTWTRINRADIPKNPDGTSKRVLKGTWAFKLKRLPDGTPLKYKARYCCRGDMQTAGIDYFDTYAPVVQWSTIRMLLTLVLKHGWSTRQVDYTNAFAQADLPEEVYIEEPRGFTGRDGTTKVLKLLKSLYGLKQAPKTFFEKLRAGLLERGFTPSNIDPCLFMKGEMMCVVYVDDTILCGPNSQDLEAEIKGLGVNNLEQRHSFQLRNEGEVGDFLGIRIEKRANGSFYLSQTGLIDKILNTTDMNDCNAVSTPTSKGAVGSDRDGLAFNEKWKYSTIIGMLLYLSGNTRPDITFAVHQCARYSHSPKQSHAMALKRIIRYLKGTRDKGMIFSPTGNFEVNCYVDADFAGLWGVEYDQDSTSVKSRTGFLIMFMNCPLLWVSKLQTQIALSTMEAEYIALSSAMRELIAIREILKEVKLLVFSSKTKPTYSMIARTFEEIPASQVYEDNESCLKFATMPRMSPRTKHIAIPYHFFRSKVVDLEIKVLPIDTTEQLADQFTKGLAEDEFVKARKRMLGW